MKIHYVCKYTPIELIESFGFALQKFEPEYANFNCAENCTHQNMCGYGKAILEDILQNNIKNLILVNCCDVMRRIYDILKSSKKMDFLFILDIPHKNDKNSIKYLQSELKRFRNELERFGNFDIKTFKESCKNYSEYNKQIYDLSKEHISIIGAHAVTAIRNTICQKTDIPVYDYTCNGYRNLNIESINENNFYEVYADKLINQQNPCSRMQFRNKTDLSKSKGVICNTIKFCDYYGFKHRDTVNQFKNPVINIETDCTMQAKEQITTRIDAFCESISKNINVITHKLNDYAVGIDIGSTCTKAVIIDNSKHIISSAILDTGISSKNATDSVINILLEQTQLKRNQFNNIVTTGYGRNTTGIKAKSVTEITCHAKGANYLYPQARTVIDIGGQDLKVITLNSDGTVNHFVMNDKCAAGTGRFLDSMARTLGMDIETMSKLGSHWKNVVEISSMCTVFAESEVISLIANNIPIEDIIHGLNMSVASKIITLSKKLNCQPEFIMTGGVAKNSGVVNAISTLLNKNIIVPEQAQMCGAIGAALFGL